MKKLLLQVACGIVFLSAQAQFHYPQTKTVDSSDTFFGKTYPDPYRWLEKSQEPEATAWFKAQANYTDSILNGLNGRDSLVAEWQRLNDLNPATYFALVAEGGKIFYRKTMPGENVSKLYYREGLSGKEMLLFDPLSYIQGKTLSIETAIPALDGKRLAIAYAEQGAEISTIRVMDVATRKFLPDSVSGTGGLIDWTPDQKGFFYMWIRSTDNIDPTARLNSKCKIHLLGSPLSSDVDYFSSTTNPELINDPSAYPYVYMDRMSPKYLIGFKATVQREQSMYYIPVAQMKAPHPKWKTLSTTDDKIVRGLTLAGEDIYAITYKNAKRYKLIKTSFLAPDWAKAETIAEEKPDQTLEELDACKDYILLVYSDGIYQHIDRLDKKTKKITPVNLPTPGVVSVNCFDRNSNSCVIGIESWIQPSTEYMFDAASGNFSPGKFNVRPEYPAAYKDLVVEEVEAKGHDGVMIPLSIIHKKGIPMDGSNVCFMDGYGAYGISMTPGFSFRRNSLAVRNVVVAIAHVRGGSEKGQDWYEAGFKATKPNTWKDFISSAEYMIGHGYTTSSKLCGTGTSAGGILISRAVTERPELFAAAICNVGDANALRSEFSPNGPVNTPEYGTVKDSAECRALYEMDGTQHVMKGTNYPAVICVGGWNDPRVAPWEPAKFAAGLQAASSSGKPVLMKVNYDNGHFTEDKKVAFRNFAGQYAFVLWQCGHPDFQPKKD